MVTGIGFYVVTGIGVKENLLRHNATFKDDQACSMRLFRPNAVGWDVRSDCIQYHRLEIIFKVGNVDVE